MRQYLIVATAVAAVLVCAVRGDEDAVPQYVFTSAPEYRADAWMRGGERFPTGASVMLVTRSGRRRIAPGFFASADPAVSFDGSRILFAGKSTTKSPWQIWEVAVDGGAPRQVTRSEGDCVRPLYLPGGQIVYTRFSAAGSDIEVAPAQRLTFAPGWYLTDDVLRDGRILFESAGELLTVYPDGTGVESLRCDHGAPRANARQISSGDVIFSSGARLARFTSALASQTTVAQPDLDSTGPVAEVSPGKWLISLRNGLFLWTKEGGRLLPLEKGNAIQPAVVARRTPPKEFPSALVPARRTGNLLCLNARDSTEGVKTVQVYTRDASGGAVLLGGQEVASDGSFYVEVPADRPLRIELRNSAGGMVRAEHGWFWMRPSEQRICVGCHTGPERAPENRVPEILLRSTTPEKLLGERK